MVQGMRKVIKFLLFPGAIFFALAGCSTGDNGSLVEQAGLKQVGEVQLSEAQVQLYQSGLKKIIAKPETASFKGVKALTFAPKPGVHICGFVSSEIAPGKMAEQQFYVELRKEEGGEAFRVHRGQIGSDEAKLAKVKFVCRQHKIGA